MHYWFEGMHSLSGVWLNPSADAGYHFAIEKLAFYLPNALLMNNKIPGRVVISSRDIHFAAGSANHVPLR